MLRNLLVVPLVCFAISALIYAAPAARDPQKTVTITDLQNGKDVEVPQGGTLSVRLPSNPTTGYSWSVAGDPAPLRFVKTKNTKSGDSKPALGAPSTQQLTFAATSIGISTLTLEYRRPWEHGGAAAKTFTVKVKVR